MNGITHRHIFLRFLCLFAAIIFSSAQGLAQQSGGIRGMVYDSDFDAPLAGAEVSIAETGQKVTASEEGNYVFSGLEPGAYTLVVSKEGYTRKVFADVVVPSGSMTDQDASLAGEFTEMEEFVAQDLNMGGSSEEGLLSLRMEAPALMDSVGAELMSQAGVGDAASALKLVSGATVQDGKYAVVRGLPDRYVNSQMNSVRLPTADPEKRAVQLDQFPSALIENIQVSKTFTPDQQGDASGGAVNVRLKSVPDERVLKFKIGAGYNSQASGADDFLTYDGGGVNQWGIDDGGRELPFGVEQVPYTPTSGDPKYEYDLGPYSSTKGDLYRKLDSQVRAFTPAMGASEGNAPMIYNWSVTAGNKFDLRPGLRAGVLGSFFYKQDAEHDADGENNKLFGSVDSDSFTPNASSEGDGRLNLYKVTESSQSVLWGGLISTGIELDGQKLGLAYMQTQSAKDTVRQLDDTTLEDTWFRNEALKYTERTSSTLQLRGDHEIPFPDFSLGQLLRILNPQLDWVWAQSDSTLYEPDKRFMISAWDVETETWTTFDPDLGGIGRRIWKDVSEDSDQFFANLKFPFEQWSGDEGFVKVGLFNDTVERKYRQDSFAYYIDRGAPFGLIPTPPAINFVGPWNGTSFADIFSDPTKLGFTSEYGGSAPNWAIHPSYGDLTLSESLWLIAKSGSDADYDGTQEIKAWYWMGDLPVCSWLKLTGGVRTEKTEMSTSFKPSDGQLLRIFEWEDETLKENTYGPGEWDAADANIDRTDVLPAVSLELEPIDGLKFRGAYSKTIARPTFKEISPVVQIEYLGGDQFIGNNSLDLSELENYDLRVEYYPTPSTFLSLSWFQKEVLNPIEYVDLSISQQPYVQPFNFPDGTLEGYELEVRQDIGSLWSQLNGLDIRLNATMIESEVTVPEILPGTDGKPLAGSLISPVGGQTIPSSRPMMGAPEYLLNVSASYEIEDWGSQFSVFYTQKGDTLVSGGSLTDDGYVPDVYAKEHGELSVGFSQKIGENLKLTLRAKNILNPDIQKVYRSDHISGEGVKSSYTKGVDYSISLSGEF